MAASETGGPTQSAWCVERAAGLDVFEDENGVAHVALLDGSVRRVLTVDGGDFAAYLAAEFYAETSKTIGAQAIRDAVNVIKAQARRRGVVRPVAVRAAAHDGGVHYDLGDGRAVEVRPGAWEVSTAAGVMFRRPPGMHPAPAPERGGQLEELRALLNLNEDDWPLWAGFVVGALAPWGTFPVLVVGGTNGTGKSTLARITARLLDPNVAELRSLPTSTAELMVGASNTYVLAFDNVSGLTAELSDALCRVSSGTALVTRALYTNSDQSILRAKRPVVLNGIGDVARRPDLLDRSLLLHLSPIPPEQRITEKELTAALDELLPRALAGVFDAVARALRDVDSVRLPQLPRLADHVRWVAAAAPALGLTVDQVLAAYQENRAAGSAVALEDSPVAGAIQILMRDRPEWIGTASELLEELTAIVGEGKARQRSWPKNAIHMGNAVERVEQDLREVGIDLQKTRTGKGRLIRFARSAASRPLTGEEPSA